MASSSSSDRRRDDGLPSLIDFGEDSKQRKEEQGNNPFDAPDAWRPNVARLHQPRTSPVSSADAFSTPLSRRRSPPPASTASPDFLTGDFPVTPPTTIPGVHSAVETASSSRWSSENLNPFDLESPFSASSSSSASFSNNNKQNNIDSHANVNNRNSSITDNSSNKNNDNSSSSNSSSGRSKTAIDNQAIASINHVRHSQSTPELKDATATEPLPAPPPPQPLATKSSSPAGFTTSLSVRRPSEFIASGGGKGVYKPPARGPVDPDRPVPLDLRPSPMWTNQASRVVVFIDGCLWLGCDGALKIWDVENAMREGSGGEGNPPDDVDAAKLNFLSLEGAVTLCLVADTANELVWSGHKDGKVRAWPSELGRKEARRAQPRLSWMAHRSPVLSMVITPYGELWTGSEAGSIRAWPWEATAHCLDMEDSHAAGSLMARCYVDLKARGTAAGAVSLGNTDVQFLLAEHCNGRVWSGGALSLALWDARTRDVLKVFGPSVQSEFSSPDISPVRDIIWDDAGRASKKGPMSFLQRVMGAADAVRRAAAGGQGGDDNKRLEALVATLEGTVWGGYASGMLVQWDSLGNRLQELLYIPVPVRCLCAVGTRIWVGYADGRLQVLADNGKVLGSWLAHNSPVFQIARGGNYVFTLAAHGGIRGWNVGSPGPVDGILQIEMQLKASSYTRDHNVKILACTWNVAEEKASLRSLQTWIAAGASEAGIVVVGLQETEMGASTIAMAVAKETLQVGFQEKNSANGQWWLDSLGVAVGEGQQFIRVGSRQLAGILIGVWVRNDLVSYIGDVEAAAVPCGFGRALGNKGGVGVKLFLFRRTFCFINSHFAAHMDAVGRRNADFEHIYHQMKFSRSSGAPVFRGASVRKAASPETQDMAKELMDEAVGVALRPDLADSDMIIWVGDFNYRIDELSYEDVLDLISVKQWDVLIPKDQLRLEMIAGRVFQGMREGSLRFQPTYKFDKGCSHALGYDFSEKRRIPAWCDRVIFRDSYDGSETEKRGKLSHPISASVMWYDSCMDVVESDHKPVRCLLNVDVAAIDEAARRRAFFELMQDNNHVKKWTAQLNSTPEMALSTHKIILEDRAPSLLKAINQSDRQAVVFKIFCNGGDTTSSRKSSHRAGFGLPLWLQVQPASGLIPPGRAIDITLRFSHVLPDDFMECGRPPTEDNNKNKVVAVLAFYFKGPLSSVWRSYQVAVSSPSSTQGPHPPQAAFRLQRSDVPVTQLNPEDAKDLLL